MIYEKKKIYEEFGNMYIAARVKNINSFMIELTYHFKEFFLSMKYMLKKRRSKMNTSRYHFFNL